MGDNLHRVVEQVGFFTGLGIVIVFLAAVALGRFTVIGVREQTLADAPPAETVPADEPAAETTRPVAVHARTDTDTAPASPTANVEETRVARPGPRHDQRLNRVPARACPGRQAGRLARKVAGGSGRRPPPSSRTPGARPVPFRLIGVDGTGRLGQGRAVGELPGRQFEQPADGLAFDGAGDLGPLGQDFGVQPTTSGTLDGHADTFTSGPVHRCGRSAFVRRPGPAAQPPSVPRSGPAPAPMDPDRGNLASFWGKTPEEPGQ